MNTTPQLGSFGYWQECAETDGYRTGNCLPPGALQREGRLGTIRSTRLYANREAGTTTAQECRTTPSAAVGIGATVKTLTNGYYVGIVNDLRSAIPRTPEQIVRRNAHEFDTWGTGADNILRVLQSF